MIKLAIVKAVTDLTFKSKLNGKLSIR